MKILTFELKIVDMKTKILLAILMICTNNISHAQIRHSKKDGMNFRGDLNLKLLYPFAPTFERNKANFELQLDDSYDNFHASSTFKDTNFTFNEKNTLLYRMGIGVEYYFHKRIPFELGVKTWRFRKDWDSNFVSQKGYFQYLSIPINLRYEIFRSKYISIKAGLGIEPYIKTYQNFAYIETSCQNCWFLGWLIGVNGTNVNKIKVNNGKARDSNMTFEFSVGTKINKRLSLDFYLRYSVEANLTQVNLNYRLHGKIKKITELIR